MQYFDRRRVLKGVSTFLGGVGLTAGPPRWAQSMTPGLTLPSPAVQSADATLVISRSHLMVDGKPMHAATVNGSSPGPLLRWREGQTVRVAVHNDLPEETSIHWHGVLVPFQMDGVPGVAFPGIKPQATFVYEFPVRQSGTYWYHSHSGMQEAEGLYGPIVIDPKDADPICADREHVIVLSDFSSLHPHLALKRLKQSPGLFNYQKQTFAGLLEGRGQSLRQRLDWGAMRMDPTDVSDVTGSILSFVINGHSPADNWTGLFRAGEKVRLRIINAAAHTIFNVRIPGLRLTVIAADGQNVQPVPVDELQIGNAETYDLIIEPQDDIAYAFVAEAVDRSGMALGTLSPRPGLMASAPVLRPRPLATMTDMGMAMDVSMGSGGMSGMVMDSAAGRGAGTASGSVSRRDDKGARAVTLGPEVQTLAAAPRDRTGEPGQGLEGVDHKVLVYQDLVSLTPRSPPTVPTRALEIHLTGNMERYIWGLDGKKFSETSQPYAFQHGERVRVTLINDTMMAHPMHLHGHFFELVHGPADRRPKKHTVVVAPGGVVTWDFTAESGDWAFHCHMLYHMHAGMFQVFSVRPIEGRAA